MRGYLLLLTKGVFDAKVYKLALLTHRTSMEGEKTLKGFVYQDTPVSIPFTADIPTDFRPGRSRAHTVQQLLDMTDPWKDGDDPIETNQVDGRMRCLTVPNDGRQPIWAVHVGHKARQPQLSPFIETRIQPLTQLLTIELAGTPERPRLVRVYPGDYTPPLPWQNSAKDADGGREYCLTYWRSHSYLFSPRVVQGRTCTTTPPNWFTP